MSNMLSHLKKSILRYCKGVCTTSGGSNLDFGRTPQCLHTTRFFLHICLGLRGNSGQGYPLAPPKKQFLGCFCLFCLLEKPLLHPGIQKNCYLYLLLVWFDNQNTLLGYHHHSDLNFPPLLHTAIMETTRYSRHPLLNVSTLYLIMVKTSSWIIAAGTQDRKWFVCVSVLTWAVCSLHHDSVSHGPFSYSLHLSRFVWLSKSLF